jgi:hypothetical protein
MISSRSLASLEDKALMAISTESLGLTMMTTAFAVSETL